MQVDRKTIEASLPNKGFVEEDTHHRYFYHEFQGKRTGAYTYTSRGTKYKTYGVSLLKRMKFELRLDSIGQVADLCMCPMSGDQYTGILRTKGTIPQTPPATPQRKGKR